MKTQLTLKYVDCSKFGTLYEAAEGSEGLTNNQRNMSSPRRMLGVGIVMWKHDLMIGVNIREILLLPYLR